MMLCGNLWILEMLQHVFCNFRERVNFPRRASYLYGKLS